MTNAPSRDPLFLNHLAFMHRHRGRVTEDKDGIHAIGPIASLQSWVPNSLGRSPPPACRAVRLAPWSGDAWPERLARMGFECSETLRYMELADTSRPIRGDQAVDVKRAADKPEALAFAKVQNAGFQTGDEEIDGWWRDYFRVQALNNLADPDQDMLLVCAGGEVVSCTLALRTPGVVGIYAVATLPDKRRRGFSGAALDHVRRRVVGEGGACIALQAMGGSYAHGYYERLGFIERYASQVWRLPEGASAWRAHPDGAGSSQCPRH